MYTNNLQLHGTQIKNLDVPEKNFHSNLYRTRS